MSENNVTCLSVVERIFSNWTALKMAVEHGMGTAEQANCFCEYIVELLTMNEQLHQTDIAGELEDYMDSEFSTQLEDNSEKEVAEIVHQFYTYFRSNDVEKLMSEVQKLPALQPWIARNQSVNRVSEATKEDDSNNTSNNEMEVDSEGFSLVRRKKK